MSDTDQKLERYRRQMRFAPLGEEGQRRLRASRALVCGCGALGSVIADQLVRAGVGHVRIVDRDFLERDNLHRQVLFDERDVAEELPKAVAAARRLRQINSEIEIEAEVADVSAANIARLAEGVDVIVDGTDNFETRYLLNDFSVANNVPWVFGGCVGAEGQTLAILPGETACLTCLLPEPPPAELQPTCETAGVIGPIVATIAALQSAEALKILSGHREAANRRLAVIDLWNNQLRSIGIARAVDDPRCRTCVDRDFPWLDGRRGAAAISLCGRNAVQLASPGGEPTSLAQLAAKLQSVGKVSANPYLLRLETGKYKITVFADGRAIIGGSDDIAEARVVHARYIGG